MYGFVLKWILKDGINCFLSFLITVFVAKLGFCVLSVNRISNDTVYCSFISRMLMPLETARLLLVMVM